MEVLEPLPFPTCRHRKDGPVACQHGTHLYVTVNPAAVVGATHIHTRCAIKHLSGKLLYFNNGSTVQNSAKFSPTLYVSIYATYPANCIKTTSVVQWIQQLKLLSSLFQVRMLLCVEQSQIVNKTVQLFVNSSNVSVTSAAHSGFEHSVQNVHQL